jgi:DNA-directed RNA polymerase specialized sigma24 family protein
MDETARLRWIASQILPYEGEVRGWLLSHATSLNSSDVDDIVQEAYSRLWTANLAAVTNARAYFYTVIRNMVAERARRARVVPLERWGKSKPCASSVRSPGRSGMLARARSLRAC